MEARSLVGKERGHSGPPAHFAIGPLEAVRFAQAPLVGVREAENRQAFWNLGFHSVGQARRSLLVFLHQPGHYRLGLVTTGCFENGTDIGRDFVASNLKTHNGLLAT
jgi:hypothetical protein